MMDFRKKIGEEEFNLRYNSLLLECGHNPESKNRVAARLLWWERLRFKPADVINAAFKRALTEMTTRIHRGLAKRAYMPALPEFMSYVRAIEQEERVLARSEIGADGLTCRICDGKGVVPLLLVVDPETLLNDLGTERPSTRIGRTGRFVTPEHALEKKVQTFLQPFGFRCPCVAGDRALPRWVREFSDAMLAEGCAPPCAV